MSTSRLTRSALAECLKKRMEHSPLSDITVKQIAADCGVNRQTFYYHFQDIFDLLGWIYRTEALEAIADCRSYNTWTDGFARVFQYILDNRRFCLHSLESLGRGHLDAYLYSVTNGLIMGVIEELAADLGVDVDAGHKAFIANFYTLAFTGLVIQWMRDDMKEDPKRLIGQLADLIEGHFVRALHTYDRR